MQKHLFTKKRRIPALSGILKGLAALLLCSMMWTNNARGAAMSGTYTISSSGNYTSFKAAIADLKANGVSGAVLFKVSAATFTENLVFNAITGASATNTITFQGQGRNKTTLTSSGLTVNMSSSPYTSYVTFDNMTISSSASSGEVWYGYYDVGCGITNSNIVGGVYSSSSIYLIESYYSTSFTLNNDRLIGGYYQWYKYGISNSSTVGFNTCTNNKFVQGGGYNIEAIYGTGDLYQNNIFDSTGYSTPYAGVFEELESGAVYNANQFLCPYYYSMEVIEPNYYAVTVNNVVLPFKITNNIFSGATEYGCIYEPEYATAPCIFAHNTVYAAAGAYYGMYLYMYGCNNNTQTFSSNLIIANSPLDYGILMYCYGGSGAGMVASMDGNDYYVIGTSTYAYFYNGSSGSTYSTYKAFITALQGTSSSWETRGTNVLPNFLNPPRNLLVDTTKTSPSGVYCGVNFDILGHKRCQLFPTAGAEEDNFGKSKPVVKFFLPANVYPNSPTTIYQTGKPGDPKRFAWYLQNSTYSTLTLVSTAANLVTSAFTVGTNCLKLVTFTCGGNDSFPQCFTVTAPTAVPGTDFIANLNTIQQGGSVSFTDLSTFGPTKWIWSITPDATYSNGVKVPTTTEYIGGLNTTQSPTVQFNFSGFYKVCMTAYN